MSKKSITSIVGTVLFALILVWLIMPWRNTFAQGPSGYTKVGSVAFGTNSYADTTVTRGDTYDYAVTAYNAAGESGPSNVVTVTDPTTGTGTPTVTLGWTPATSGGTPTGYNVYRFLVQVPGPPTSLGATAQ